MPARDLESTPLHAASNSQPRFMRYPMSTTCGHMMCCVTCVQHEKEKSAKKKKHEKDMPSSSFDWLYYPICAYQSIIVDPKKFNQLLYNKQAILVLTKKTNNISKALIDFAKKIITKIKKKPMFLRKSKKITNKKFKTYCWERHLF